MTRPFVVAARRGIRKASRGHGRIRRVVWVIVVERLEDAGGVLGAAAVEVGVVDARSWPMTFWTMFSGTPSSTSQVA
jgi:hypothetical protein